MKKIISLLLAFVMVLSVVTVSYAETVTDESYTDAYRLVTQLGLIEDADENEEFNENMIVLRKDFVSAVINAYGDMAVESSKVVLSFKDVETTSPYYEKIATAVAMDIMHGYSADSFAPDEPISGIQAVKVLIHALGYDIQAYYKGGYPTGYSVVAKELGLLNGLSDFNFNDYLTVKNFARILINFLRTYPYEANGIKGEDLVYTHSKENFGEKHLKLQYGAGIVTGNSETMLADHEDLDEGYIFINNTVYNYGRYDDEFIGRYVEYFFSVDELSENKIKAITKKDKYEEEFVLSSDEIVSVNGNRLNYEENGSIKTVSYAADAKIVYNGEMLLSYDFNNVSAFDTCFITFVENNGASGYDVVFVNNYDTVVVDNHSIDKGIITDMDSTFKNSVNNQNAIKKLDISDSKNKEVIVIDKNGNFIDKTSIVKGDIISFYENSRVIKIFVSKDIRDIRSEYTEDKYFVSEDTYYRISGCVPDVSEIEPNTLYTVYFDVFERAVYFVEGISDYYRLGYLISHKPAANQFKDTYYKIYSEKGEFETLVQDENFFVNGTSYKSSATPPEVLDGDGNFKRQLIKYKKTDDGKLKEILTADTTIGEEGSSFFAGPSINTALDKMYGNTYSFVTWGGIVNADAHTVIFSVPSDLNVTDESKFDIVPYDRLKVLTYKLDSYYTNIDSQAADAIVNYTNVDIVNFDCNAGIVVSRTGAKNSEGDSVYKLKLLVNNVETDLVCSAELNSVVSAIDKGDVLRYEVDEAGVVADIRHIYDASEKTYLLSSNPSYSAYVSSVRESYGKVVKISNDFIRVSYDIDKTYTPLSAFSLESYHIPKFKVTVVKNLGNGKIHVEAGDITDIDTGDKVVIVTRSSTGKALAVIKD